MAESGLVVMSPNLESRMPSCGPVRAFTIASVGGDGNLQHLGRVTASEAPGPDAYQLFDFKQIT